MPDPAEPVPSPTPSPAPVTQVLAAIARGDRQASDQLLPMVYDELRRLARQHMANEAAAQTLQPTALVHEAYLRLVGPETVGGQTLKWDSRGHFFASAALAMRRILVERARSRNRLKRGGDRGREQLTDDAAVREDDSRVDLTELDQALTKFERHDARRYQVVMLRYFAGLSIEDTAQALSLSSTTVKSDWNYARAWLHREMAGES